MQSGQESTAVQRKGKIMEKIFRSIITAIAAVAAATIASASVFAGSHSGPTDIGHDDFMDLNTSFQNTELTGGYWCDGTDIALIVTYAYGIYRATFYEADWNQVLYADFVDYGNHNYGLSFSETWSSPNVHWNDIGGSIEIGENLNKPSDSITRPLLGNFRKVTGLIPLSSWEIESCASALGVPYGTAFTYSQQLGFSNSYKMFVSVLDIYQGYRWINGGCFCLDEF